MKLFFIFISVSYINWATSLLLSPLRTLPNRHSSFCSYAVPPIGYSRDYIPHSVERLPQYSGVGCVLIADPSVEDSKYNKAAVFVYHHDEGSQLVQGLLLDRPTPYVIGDVASGIHPAFHRNTLFLGGEDGDDMATVIHTFPFDGFAKNVGSGIFSGGLKMAEHVVSQREALPSSFKFLTKNCQWQMSELESQIASGQWAVFKVPPSMVLRQGDDEGVSLWQQCRNVVESNR